MYLYLIWAIGRRLPSWYPVPHVLLSGYYYGFCRHFCTRLSGSYWLFYELIVLMCIFYSSNKGPLRAFGIGLGESVMVIAQSWPFCTGNTCISSVQAFWAQIQPCKHCGVSIMGRKSNSRQCIANCGYPGCDIISNVQEMAYVVIHSRICHVPEV